MGAPSFSPKVGGREQKADRSKNRQEGFHAFYKGITPRIMRVAPGQAVTFTVYEYLKDKLETSGPAILVGGKYEE
jgi:solute carrier family 25 citrate transporter 1